MSANFLKNPSIKDGKFASFHMMQFNFVAASIFQYFFEIFFLIKNQKF